MIKINYLDNRAPLEDDQTKATHRKYAGFPGAEISISNFRTTMTRTIDTRPCEPLRAADAEWGEQDDGSHGRTPKMATSIKLAIDPTAAQEGDR